MESDTIKIMVANESHYTYIDEILSTIEESSKDRGTGIAKRSPEYVKNKMAEGKAIIALDGEVFAGFCYIESWGNKQYVANSGLIVNPTYRGHGVAKKIKKFSFDLSRQRFPNAKLFGLTSGAAVMKINTELGYVPVTFADLTDDEEFWKGCQGCVNFDVLQRTNRRYCICTAMLNDPNDPNRRNREEKENEAKKQNKKSVITDFINKFKKLK